MNNAELVKMYRYLHDDLGEDVAGVAQWMLDNAGSRVRDHQETYRLNCEHTAEGAGLPVAPGAMAWRWMIELDRMPWIYCHDCGELATVMDRMEEATEGACACWDDPPPWIGPYGDMGYDPADTIPPERWTPADDEALRACMAADDELARFWTHAKAIDVIPGPESIAEVVE